MCGSQSPGTRSRWTAAGRGRGRRLAAATGAGVVLAFVVTVAGGGVAQAQAVSMSPMAALGAEPSVVSVVHEAAHQVAVLAVNDLPTIVRNLRNWLMGLLAALATLFLTVGGVRYLMAGGDPSEVERAKAAFRSAMLGYALAVIAPVVLTILQSIIGG